MSNLKITIESKQMTFRQYVINYTPTEVFLTTSLVEDSASLEYLQMDDVTVSTNFHKKFSYDNIYGKMRSELFFKYKFIDSIFLGVFLLQ